MRCLTASCLAAAIVALLAGPTLAQAPSSTGVRTPPAAKAPAGPPAGARDVRVLQVDETGAPLGEPLRMMCPGSGCEGQMALLFDGEPQQFGVAVEFVAKGAYVVLRSRSVAISAVVPFDSGSPAAIFIPNGVGRPTVRRVPLAVTFSRTVREVRNSAADPETLAEGRVFIRKRTPDAFVQLEVAPPVPGIAEPPLETGVEPGLPRRLGMPSAD
jgi:hypothetical protein